MSFEKKFSTDGTVLVNGKRIDECNPTMKCLPRGGDILLKIRDGNRIELIGNSLIILKGKIIVPI